MAPKQGLNRIKPSLLTNFVNNAKNKTVSLFNGVYNTVKSDLGFGPQNERYSFEKDIDVGCRLFAYSLLTKIAVNYLLSKIMPLDNLPLHYIDFLPENSNAVNYNLSDNLPPNFMDIVNQCIVTPFGLETIFTWWIPQKLGPKYGSIIGLMLYGAIHYKNDPKACAIKAIVVAAGSIPKYLHARSKKDVVWAPFVSHAINNALALYISAKMR
jgi:membrane protease YdiL (CAAX protease family)